MEAQNVYDRPDFFEVFSQMTRSRLGLEGMPEWQSINALLPDLKGKHIVDLGCGFGYFTRFAAEQGAGSVHAVDLSENMLARAKSSTTSPQVSFERQDLNNLALPAEKYDVAFSSLAFHYVEDLSRLLATIHQALKPGSRLVFTMEHPIFLAISCPQYVTGPDGRRIWPLEGYSNEGKRSVDWLKKGIIKYQRTIGTVVNTLIKNGFQITHVEEWRPSALQLQEQPELQDEVDRPMILIVQASRQ